MRQHAVARAKRRLSKPIAPQRRTRPDSLARFGKDVQRWRVSRCGRFLGRAVTGPYYKLSDEQLPALPRRR